MIPASDRTFVASLCRAWAGLHVDPDKAYLIESQLAAAARREGYDSAAAFVEALRAGGDQRLGWAAVEALAICDSSFFRDRAVFEALVERVLPGLARDRGAAPVRVWSAGCGAGQEIYSLAMLLEDSPTLAARVELSAADLAERRLERARAGLYSQFEVQQGLPARTLVRCFERRGEMFVLSPRLRQRVRWRRVNLTDDLSPLGQFELILCRNVLSYLAPEAQRRVGGALARRLAPGGRLVLGSGEKPAGDLAVVDPGIGLFEAAAALTRAA